MYGYSIFLSIDKWKQITSKNYWTSKKRLCVRLLDVINNSWENLQIAKHNSVPREWNERLSDLCFAICRFSQETFISHRATSRARTIFFFLFPVAIVPGIHFVKGALPLPSRAPSSTRVVRIGDHTRDITLPAPALPTCTKSSSSQIRMLFQTTISSAEKGSTRVSKTSPLLLRN